MGGEATRRRWRDGGGLLWVGGAEEGEGVVVPLEVAASYRARTTGLLGRDGIEGAMLLAPASGVHTFRMRFAIDVAYLDRNLRVIDMRTMRPGRLGRPRLRARCVLEAAAGAMAGWGLAPGKQVAVGPPHSESPYGRE